MNLYKNRLGEFNMGQHESVSWKFPRFASPFATEIKQKSPTSWEASSSAPSWYDEIMTSWPVPVREAI